MAEKQKSKNGRGNRALIILGTAAFMILASCACISLSPEWMRIAEAFLPPNCDGLLFDEVIANPSTKMKLIQDIFQRTQVIAFDEAGQDICYFRSISYSAVASSDGKYLAFTETQQIAEREYIQHFFIVNIIEESYTRFTPENPDESFSYADIAWSPDSTKLAYVSFSDSMCCVPAPDGYITLISAEAEQLWRVTIGSEGRHHWGDLLWAEDGETIRYGRDEAFIMGKPIGQPFWCSVNQDGSNLLCEDVEIED